MMIVKRLKEKMSGNACWESMLILFSTLLSLEFNFGNLIKALYLSFDSAQMGHDGIFSKPQGNTLPYAQESARNLTQSFEDNHLKAYFRLDK